MSMTVSMTDLLPGKASLRERAQVRVEPGRSIDLMPDDIHAVANADAPVIRHIHFYGRALEVLDRAPGVRSCRRDAAS